MKVEKILISQPQPADLDKSPYGILVREHNLDITFYKFFDVVGITASEFRKNKIHPSEYTAVIFNSKHSVDHFFRLAKELRETIPETMKYFCCTEAIALYLQNYIQYRKRKIFFGTQFFADLIEVMSKHRDEKFLFPCSDEKQTEYTKMLDKAKFKYKKAPMYRSVPKDLTQFRLKDYDMIALFSPIGVRSLLTNFPNFQDDPVPVAAFGAATHAALNAAGIKITIAAPTKSSPSMAMAIENFLKGKTQETVIISKPTSSRTGKGVGGRGSLGTIGGTVTGGKKAKSVINNKAKYRQMLEEKKAKAAERKAAREVKKKEAIADSASQPTATAPTE
ncbi:MAG: uroporphyrinogen-III synthase [Bacteroidales bacterium]|nr:uroporphyrinogen-III synthase [Bacteroidales bacterium]